MQSPKTGEINNMK